METSLASEKRTIKKKAAAIPWMQVYTTSVSLVGMGLILVSLSELPENRAGLLLFGLLAGLTELFSVELFSQSRARISVSSIISLASILLFGPFAGALTHMVSGLTTLITTGLRSEQPAKGRVSWIQRTMFNTGMWVIAASAAGHTYMWLGGSFHNVIYSGNILPFLAAVAVDALVNAILLITVISIQTGRKAIEIWRQDFQWSAPIAMFGGFLGGGALGLAFDMYNILGVIVFFFPVLATSYSFQLYVAHTKEYLARLEHMNQSLDEANLGLLETLGAVIDAYDMYTAGHSLQVATYADAFAQKMGLPQKEVDLIVKASLVHDVGKVGIMDSITGKQGLLTDEEFKIMARHPVIGAEIVGRMNGLKDLAPLVLYHHERFDGRGYPDGLKGEEIPLGARVITVADSLDAMCSDRPYRPTRNFAEIRDEIYRCAGKQFDPQVVEAFRAVLEEQGREFFRNSASTVDTTIIGKLGMNTRYLKKSMIDK